MARILVPFDGSAAAEYVLDMACGTAADNGDEVHAVYVICIPSQLPITARIPSEQAFAEHVFARAHAIADLNGACLFCTVVEARSVGPAIVEAARDCDCIIVGQPARTRFYERLWPRRALRYILKHARCQVLIGYAPREAASAAPHRFLLSPWPHTPSDERLDMASPERPDNVLPLQARRGRDEGVALPLGREIGHPAERVR